MFTLSIVSFITALIFHSYNTVSMFIKNFGYTAVFVLMVMESSSVPIPSEVVLPLAGFFSAKGALSFPLALLVAVSGSMVGSVIDYTIGYYVGKEVVYKHLRFFHIKKQDLDNFDRWFEKNGIAAVFLTRLVPVIRTVVNFPAGFARLSLKSFLFYTLIGLVIWDFVLMVFGYYILSVNSAVIVMAGIGVFALLLYIIYNFSMKRMKK